MPETHQQKEAVLARGQEPLDVFEVQNEGNDSYLGVSGLGKETADTQKSLKIYSRRIK